MSAEVMRVIDDLADDEQFQVAMVIVTHDLPAVRRIADTVHVLEKGRVVHPARPPRRSPPAAPVERHWNRRHTASLT